MKKLKGVGALILALAFLPGCDTEQPTLTGTQNVTLDFANYTQGLLVDVWDRYVDVNQNGTFDVGEPFNGTECGDIYPPPTGSRGEPLQFAAPWGFSAEVKVIRAGQVTSTLLIPASAANGFPNIPTASDDQTEFFADPPIPDSPPGFDPSFVYVTPRRMINTSSDVIKCTIPDVPVTNLAGHPLPFPLTLEPGDTLVVKAGRDPHPILPAWVQFPGSFDALMRVNGIIVTPQGSTTTLLPDGIISFSYQVR